MAFSLGPPKFLTFHEKKYNPSIEWNDEERLLQDPRTHAPYPSNKDFKVSSFLFLLDDLLICCLVGKFMVRHCHCWLSFALVGVLGCCMIWMEIIVWTC